jgi:hypothetical protein
MTKKEMTTQDIVKNSYEVKELGLDWEEMYITLHAAIKSNQVRVLRSGNTLFAINIISPEEAEVFAFNAEKSFKDYIRNLREFGKAMEKAGYKKVTAEGANIQIINAMKHTGYPVEIEKVGKDSNGAQLYKATIRTKEEA